MDVQIGLFEFSLNEDDLASVRDIATRIGWKPKAFGKSLNQNIDASRASPAAAAQLAQDGHTITPQESSELLQNGRASKTAIVTSPPGAEVYIDGNKAGVTPLSFVLLRREKPRVVTIKLAGYKTVEKQFVPDGEAIPVAITLERDK